VQDNLVKGNFEGSGAAILEGAYALETPDDNREYYALLAEAYDAQFADELGYIFPVTVANALLEMRPDISASICDIGCGTGLVASHIKAQCPKRIVDGVDISKQMLDVARGKKLYQNLYEIDLTSDICHLSRNYTALVSAGTFTHGHLGPASLHKLIMHCGCDTMFCIGINQVHYEKHGFAQCLADLVTKGKITLPDIFETKIYCMGDSQPTFTGKYSTDSALICRFQIST
jgi:SAM-dependent methyltransferase